MSRVQAGEGMRNGWIILVLLGIVVAFLGGSSRPDAIQLIALRPLAALFLAAAIYFASGASLASIRSLVVLFLFFAGWMALQLVPLPAGLWHLLPGRGPLAAIDAAAGLEGVWRPISMVPTRGINALASLVVPAAGLVLAAALGARVRTLLLAVVMIGALDAVVAIFQVIGGGTSKLYLYSITNRAAPVGLFANQNHSAVFSALSLVVVAYLATDRDLTHRRPWMSAILAALFLLLLMVALIGESRAGLLTTILALAASGVIFWQNVASRSRPRSRGRGPSSALPRRAMSPRWLLIAGIVSVGGLVAAFVALDRIPALTSIADRGAFEDVRWQLLPVLRDMVSVHWMLGTGFGSFEEAYHIFEPDALLYPQYINQAHNDWIQLVIEGGLPASAIALAALFGFARGLARMARAEDAPVARTVFWLSVAAIILAASLVDYPMRTPIFQLVAMWLAVAFHRESTRPEERTDRPRS